MVELPLSELQLLRGKMGWIVRTGTYRYGQPTGQGGSSWRRGPSRSVNGSPASGEHGQTHRSSPGGLESGWFREPNSDQRLQNPNFPLELAFDP